jgi:hypothetical protein
MDTDNLVEAKSVELDQLRIVCSQQITSMLNFTAVGYFYCLAKQNWSKFMQAPEDRNQMLFQFCSQDFSCVLSFTRIVFELDASKKPKHIYKRFLSVFLFAKVPEKLWWTLKRLL